MITKTENQVLCVLRNDVTKQFFVSVHNETSSKFGLDRHIGNYRWVVKRMAEYKNNKDTDNMINKSVLHTLDNGLFWAFANSNVEDWTETRVNKLYKISDVAVALDEIAATHEALGYKNVRVKESKAPTISNNPMVGKWGSWNSNKPWNTFNKQMLRIFKQMGKDITPEISKVIKDAYFLCIKEQSPITNKYDLYNYFVSAGVIRG